MDTPYKPDNDLGVWYPMDEDTSANGIGTWVVAVVWVSSVGCGLRGSHGLQAAASFKMVVSRDLSLSLSLSCCMHAISRNRNILHGRWYFSFPFFFRSYNIFRVSRHSGYKMISTKKFSLAYSARIIDKLVHGRCRNATKRKAKSYQRGNFCKNSGIRNIVFREYRWHLATAYWFMCENCCERKSRRLRYATVQILASVISLYTQSPNATFNLLSSSNYYRKLEN